MTWKRYSAIGVIFLCLLSCGLVVASFASDMNNPGVTKANFDRIEIGMTYEQVEELLGPGSGCGRLSLWSSEEGMSFLIFIDGKVQSKNWTPGDESFWRRMCRRLGISKLAMQK